jgi:autotransporter adhesin
MNRIFSKVWNASLAKWVVASEFAKRSRRSSSTGVSGVSLLFGVVLSLAALPAVATDSQLDQRAQTLDSAGAKTTRVVSSVGARPTGSADIPSHLVDANGATDGSEDAAATGLQALAAGANSAAVGIRSSALGANSIADGNESTALGAGSVAYDDNGTALGAKAIAQGKGASAIGSGASTRADYATAMGYGSYAVGTGSLALGFNAQASGINAIAQGQRAISEGNDSVAMGTNGYSLGIYSMALGMNTRSLGPQSVALGKSASAVANNSTALGAGAYAGGTNSLDPKELGGATAIGYLAEANGDGSIALGRDSFANVRNDGSTYAVAIGAGAIATGTESLAIGRHAMALNNLDQAIGVNARAGGGGARNLAIGNGAMAGYLLTDRGNSMKIVNDSIALGTESQATANRAQAMGVKASANGEDSTATGVDSMASSDQSSAYGAQSEADGVESSALGSGSMAYDNNSTAVGAKAIAQGIGSSALGSGASTAALYATAVGYGAYANAKNSIALGAYSIANQANTVSVGSVGNERRITNVGAGIGDTDTVNVSQLKSVVAGTDKLLAVSVSYDDASTKAKITLGGAQGTLINNLAKGALSSDSTDAVNGNQLYATNQAVGKLDARVSNVESTVSNVINLGSGQAGMFQVSKDNIAAPTASGSNATAGGASAVASGANSTAIGSSAQATAKNAVALGSGSVAARDNSVSVGSTGHERQVTHVAAGTQGTDAVNLNQLAAQTKQAISTAQTYTDASSRQTLQSANAYTDQQVQGIGNALTDLRGRVNDQFRQQSRRIDQTGAMGAAMTQMAVNTAGLKTDNRLGAGIGLQGSQTALSVGYQRVLKRDGSATLSVGGSVSNGGNAAVGVGAGFGW